MLVWFCESFDRAFLSIFVRFRYFFRLMCWFVNANTGSTLSEQHAKCLWTRRPLMARLSPLCLFQFQDGGAGNANLGSRFDASRGESMFTPSVAGFWFRVSMGPSCCVTGRVSLGKVYRLSCLERVFDVSLFVPRARPCFDLRTTIPIFSEASRVGPQRYDTNQPPPRSGYAFFLAPPSSPRQRPWFT